MNYYNYFTEVEEHFQRARNSGMFMMSPLDWALVESWKDAGIPLDAVLRGIDRAFEKYHARRRRASTVNSVAYCAQEVIRAGRQKLQVRAVAAQRLPPGFEQAALAGFLQERVAELRELAAKDSPGRKVFEQTASTLESLAEDAVAGRLDDLEEVEQRLTALEDRVMGVAAGALSEERLLALRRELEAQLKPYRRKMTSQHISMLEQRFMRRRSLEELGLSRLSLFYVE